jgi:5-methylthioadenosine/S-adenosylhomocysteine deaminase
MVESATGKRNIEYLRDVGLTAPHVVLAHCVHLDDVEMEILRSTGTHVAHCPSSNLKLASGVARVAEMLDLGVSVSLGADGAPCNNRLDMFTEMRAAALLQKVLRGSRALPALTALRMATNGGARALGLADQIGSVEAGKRADLQLINLNHLHTTPQPDPISTIVYSAEASDVETVIIDGNIVMRAGDLITLKDHDVIADARDQSQQLSLRVSASK